MNARAITVQPRKQWSKRSIIAVPFKIIVYYSVMLLTGWVIDCTGLIADKRMAHVSRGN